MTVLIGELFKMAYSPKNANGQAAMAASEPVVIASDQSAVPVSGTITANIGTAGTLATAAKQDTGNTSVASIDTKTPALGQALAAASVPIVLTAAQLTTLTPPAAITNYANETGGNLATIAGKDFATQTTLAAINAKLVSGTDIGDVTINNASGAAAVNIQDGGNSVTVDAPVGTPVFVRLSDGSAAIATLPVSLASVPSHAVTNAGTFATQVDGSALTALQLIDDPVFADDAAYTLSTSKGQVIEGVAVETDGTDPTSVSAEGDAAAVRTDRNRRMLVNGMHPNSFVLFEDHTSAQTNNQLKAAPGANLSLYITDIIFSNGATAGSIKLVEDEGGTPVQITQTVYMAINGGAVMNFLTPKRLTANKTLGFTSTTVTTHSVEVHGYIAP